MTRIAYGFALSLQEKSTMFPRSYAPLRQMCYGGLLLAAMGCSRSAVVVAPEGASHADELAATPIVRGQDGESDGASFSFPDDAGGVLLAKVLPPKETEAARVDRTEPLRRSALSANWKPPALPLPASHAAMPRLPDPAKPVPLRPRLVIEETLDGLSDVPVLPQLPSLPDAGRVRVPSVDVNEPLALPVLAHPVPDRASLDDPTAEASVEAALTATIPPRTAKAPFLKMTLPDPYDHRRPETMTGLPETEQPAAGTPRIPRSH
jgi:hypothetical protein